MMSELFDLELLSLEDYEKIFQASNRALKRKVLLDGLHISAIDEEDELRKSIMLDFCLDVIVFASSQGFMWEKVHESVKFAMVLLKDTACQGRGTDDAVDTFKRMISKSTLPPKEKKALIQYFLSTFFRHYSLYLFCMTKEREVNQGDISAKIEAPFLVDNLSKGIELDKWNFQQSLLKIEEEKEELRTERVDVLKKKIEQLESEKQKTVAELDNVYENLNPEELTDVLEKLTKLHVEFMDSEIQKSLEDSKDNVEFTMKKGAVAKPESGKRRPVSRNRPKSKQRK